MQENSMEYEDRLVKCLTSTGVELYCIMYYDLSMVVRDCKHNEGRKKKHELSVGFEPRITPI